MKVFKSVMHLLILVTLIGAAYLCGIYSTKYQHNIEENKSTITTIAVVNADIGSYASELICYPDTNFQTASLTAAKEGILNNRYAAYILIPEDFSANVESVNKQPVKSQITYTIAEGLRQDVQFKVVNDIHNFIVNLGANVSYMYVDAILKELHGVQDDSGSIMQNDIADMEAIVGVENAELIEEVVYEPLDVVETEIQYLDLSDDYERLSDAVTVIDTTYEENVTSAEAELEAIRDMEQGVYDEVSAMSEVFAKVDILADDEGNLVYEEGMDHILDYPDAFVETVNQKKLAAKMSLGFKEGDKDPERPEEPEKPDKPVEPEEPDKPAETVKLSETEETKQATGAAETEETDKSSEVEDPEETDKSSEAGSTTETDKPSEAGQPEGTDKSSEAGQPEGTDKSSETEDPEGTDKSSEAGNPTETDKPSETGKSEDPKETEEGSEDTPAISQEELQNALKQKSAGTKLWNQLVEDNPDEGTNPEDGKDPDNEKDPDDEKDPDKEDPDEEDSDEKDSPTKEGLLHKISEQIEALEALKEEELEEEYIEQINDILEDMGEFYGLFEEYYTNAIIAINEIPDAETFVQGIRDIYNDEIVVPVDEETEAEAERVESAVNSAGEAIETYVTELEEYDFMEYMEEEKVQEQLDSLYKTIDEMEAEIIETDEAYIAYIDEVTTTADSNAEMLQENLDTAYEQTVTNVGSAMDRFKQNRTDLNAQNVLLLNDITEKLPYTRLGNLEYLQVYDFIATPLETNDQSVIKVNLSPTSINIDLQDLVCLFIGIIALITIYIGVQLIYRKNSDKREEGETWQMELR